MRDSPRTTRNAKLHPITPAVTIDNRREITRDPNVKALNWEELFLHFQQVVQIQQPETYCEAIRSDPTRNRTYIRSTTNKVNDYNSFGLENLQKNMILKGVKQNFERYADGSADELLQPMTNVINIGALHNTWIMINPRDITATAKIATTLEKKNEYIRLGYKVLNHEVDSLETIGHHTTFSRPITEIRVEGVRIRQETWQYATRAELAQMVEKGTDTFLPALDWDVTINTKNCKDQPGCLFSKDNYYLMLQHYCSIHLPIVNALPPHMPWKDFGRKEAVKQKPKTMTYLEWARNLAADSPICPA